MRSLAIVETDRGAELDDAVAQMPSIADVIENFDHMLTIEELAELIQFAPKTLYSKVKRGSIPVTRLGGSLRFDPKRTADWLRDQTA
jgi:excisionase family DNA binding protein